MLRASRSFLCQASLGQAWAIVRKLSSLVLVDVKGAPGAPRLDAGSTLTAARQLGGPITLLLAGRGMAEAAAVASHLAGVSHVLLADDACLEHSLAGPYAQLVKAVQDKRQFTHILAVSSSFGRDVLPRCAALLGVQPVTDVTRILDADTYVRPVYAGNAFATVKYAGPEGPRMLTVRPTAFPADDYAPSSSAATTVEAVSAEELAAASGRDWGAQWVGEDISQSARPELGSAKAVVCGGRALKSADNFKMLERIADLLGGAVGASRAAVDAGYVPNDLQVGQTGKVVAPELYIGVGISGAIQHLAGMKDSKTIVAINTDGDAPIFQVSDYGLVQDLFTALPELEQELIKAKGKAA